MIKVIGDFVDMMANSFNEFFAVMITVSILALFAIGLLATINYLLGLYVGPDPKEVEAKKEFCLDNDEPEIK